MSLKRLDNKKSDELTDKYNRECGLLRQYEGYTIGFEEWGRFKKKYKGLTFNSRQIKQR